MKIAVNTAAADAVITSLAEREPRGDFGRHISDLTACLRKRWLDHYAPPSDTPDPLLLTFLRGEVLHKMLSLDAEELSLTRDLLLGTIDHIDDDGHLWEWKTTMIWAGKLDDPSAWPESWLMQVAAYVYMAEMRDINVGVLHLQGDGRSNRLAQLRVYTLEFTPEELSDNWLTLMSRSAIITATGGDTMTECYPVEPPVTTRLGSWECKSCAHLAHCLPDLNLLKQADPVNGSKEDTQ